MLPFVRRALFATGFATLLAVGCGGSTDPLFDDSTSTGSGGGGGATTTTTTTTTTVTTGGQCSDDGDCVLLGDACHDGVCADGVCTVVARPEGSSCNDGQFCTEGDTCQGGTCVGGTAKVCAPDGNPCHVGVCDEASDTCSVAPGNDGAACDDNDACTQTGTCAAGACAKGQPVDCSAFDGPCTIGVCGGPQGCVAMPANDGAACDDGLFCTATDHCNAGACVGDPLMCPVNPDPCQVYVCDEAANQCVNVPGNNGAPCDDGSVCTSGETCAAGFCKGGAPANDGAACNDGSACTQNDVCAAGTCTGTIGGFTVYFADDFANASKGWTLGTEWQIGPAMASNGGTFNPDPATDHSPGNDNGVAGVVIGGNATTMQHPYYFMESPPFDTSAAPAVVLSFYRWLNSDWDPWMKNTIQVFDGNAWVEIWASGDQPIQDDAWMYIEHDITQYKNVAMRIRFGVRVTQNGAFDVGSWNIDDVLVGAAACP